ncbi:MAG: hypothetical protein CVV27_00715 [Candidatus Melainabacteria bacterium HGW-Melainabacteria-1]|nr:MAG: hypothetical protein CVV27_00715 [Candidatus Melainabacteria bacterium HGW-Melainabacteria-1]
MQFLFPCDYFDKHLPDEMFRDQAHALQSAGHHVYTLDLDQPGSPIRPRPDAAPMLYRGYMLDPKAYASLEQTVQAQGASLLIPSDMYLRAHHLPGWYPLIQDLTPETVCYRDAAEALAALPALGWKRFFLKDFVKSLKSGAGSIAATPVEAAEILSALESFRGQLEGGICVRRVLDLQVDSERRYFVWRGRAFASCPQAPIPALVQACCERVDSDFFSVDIAQDASQRDWVIEIGDGQVSDLVGWSAEAFARIFATAC